ncbi:hypothetical protein L3Q82_022601 [Scortum barcoo]|uniref:Uncharacterized protein n=1 Tax=Scortum barcoo TaxID=214431 RepID=A0ACB8X262_9TELE|nr:hypothetical protein L3Q82_022601 [Scortum barcoo]
MIMAFDRYVAICSPLRYATIMTNSMVVKLSVSAWGTAFVMVAILVGLSVRLSRCRRVIFNPFCDNASLFKLSCESVLINDIYGLGYTVVLLGSSLGSVTLTYLKIAAVCLLSKNKNLNSKALQTCATHLAVYVILLVSAFLIVILHRFPQLSDHRKVASVMGHVVLPALNAVIYGLQIKEVRQRIVALFQKNKVALMDLWDFLLLKARLCTMENQTLSTDILLVEGLKVTPQSFMPAFILLLLIYIFIMVSNIGLVVLISMERSLHQPMYLLFCNMSVNDMLGATAIIPRLLSDIFIPIKERYIYYIDCALQAFFAHFHGGASHTVLMIMAFDRYVAICSPLRYATIMTNSMVVKLSVSAWGTAFVMVAILVGLSVRLSRCRRVIFNPFCDNASLFKLSCESVLINDIYGLGYTVVLLGSSLGSVTLTYLKIAAVCLLSKNKNLNSKALQTCATHMAVYVIMFVSGSIIIILHRFPLLSDERKLASILFHVVPPALNAVIYGLQIKAIRQKIFIMFAKNTMTVTEDKMVGYEGFGSSPCRMENETFNLDILQLEGLKVSPESSIPAFVLLLLIYIFIMVSNIGLVVLIFIERSLHQPMYLLFCNMSINDAFGATTIIPRVLSDVFTPMTQRYIHYYECVIQAFCAHFHGGASHTVLIIMAFDRYVAICNPLRYATIMTNRMVVKLSVSAWAVAFLLIAVSVGLSVRLSRCRQDVINPFCDNASLFKLSCENIIINHIYGLISAMGTMACSLCSVMLTYLRIAMVCLSSKNKNLNSKALQTCATHLAVYVILLFSGSIIIILHRFPSLSDERKLASILFHVLPPSMNAIIYGLQIKATNKDRYVARIGLVLSGTPYPGVTPGLGLAGERLSGRVFAHPRDPAGLSPKWRLLRRTGAGENEWQKLKKTLTTAPVLAFYDHNKKIKVSTDASKDGIGAVLLQAEGKHWKPVAYASRAMTRSECKYAQIEKECLGVAYGVERFHRYIYGLPSFIVETDHRPLVSIIKKNLNEMSPRIQRLMMKMQRYDFELVYTAGKHLFLADALSRAPAGSCESTTDEDVEHHVNMVSHALPVSDTKYRQIAEATTQNTELQRVIQNMDEGWPVGSCPQFYHIRGDLSFVNGLLVQKGRIVIPQALRQDILNRIHEGHLGIEKCKRRARESVYWPGLNKDIETLVSRCDTCQKQRSRQSKEPMVIMELPTSPWHKPKSPEVVRKLLGGKAPGVDEIRPEYLKSLDVVGLSWLTRLCNIVWRLGCFVDLEKAFDRVPRGILWGCSASMGSGGLLLRAVRSLYDRSRSLVRIAGSKSDLFSSACWTPAGLPFVTGPVHNLYGQDF